jgi:hypothetical protein
VPVGLGADATTRSEAGASTTVASTFATSSATTSATWPSSHHVIPPLGSVPVIEIFDFPCSCGTTTALMFKRVGFRPRFA